MASDAAREGVTGARSPIFVLGMQRGGTNLAVNLLRAHPRCYWPEGELHEVLRGRKGDGWPSRLRKLAWYAPILARNGDFLEPMRNHAPGDLSGLTGWLVKTAIERSVRRNRSAVKGYHARLSDHRAGDGVAATRMALKVVNGNVGLAWDLDRLYGGATFVALVRHPFAVCEGLMWRGASLERAIEIYRLVIDTIMRLANDKGEERVAVIRYEDLISKPVDVARAMYRRCGLDLDSIEWVRLQDKTRDAHGCSVRVERFYRLGEIDEHMRMDRNEKQTESLSENARARIAHQCGVSMVRFGYDR